jgi:VWFA-related protein
MRLDGVSFCFVALITGCIVVPSDAPAQVDISNRPLVSVGVVATDKSGQPYLDLKSTKLGMEENGHQAAIQSVDLIARPQSICVVVDTSASNRAALPMLKSSVLRLLQQLS